MNNQTPPRPVKVWPVDRKILKRNGRRPLSHPWNRGFPNNAKLRRMAGEIKP